MTYAPPEVAGITELLAKAGADENAQIRGLVFIYAALVHAGKKKRSADDASALRNALEDVGDALIELDSLSDIEHEWHTEIRKLIERARDGLEFSLSARPGGHRETAHSQFARSLRRMFEGENLPIVISSESPFVCLFAHCVGMDPLAAKTTLLRMRK